MDCYVIKHMCPKSSLIKITITEEMRFHKKIVAYNNNTMPARRCHTSRQQCRKTGDKAQKDKTVFPVAEWIVERSHRVDNEIFYARRRFSSEEEMYKSFKRYAARTNNICRAILKFKSPNEILREYLTRVA